MEGCAALRQIRTERALPPRTRSFNTGSRCHNPRYHSSPRAFVQHAIPPALSTSLPAQFNSSIMYHGCRQEETVRALYAAMIQRRTPLLQSATVGAGVDNSGVDVGELPVSQPLLLSQQLLLSRPLLSLREVGPCVPENDKRSLYLETCHGRCGWVRHLDG
jgi:hypothetical protein